MELVDVDDDIPNLESIPNLDSVPKITVLPEQLQGFMKDQALTYSDFKDAQSLARWLARYGIDISLWGVGSNKDVEQLLKELHHQEAGLELWRGNTGEAKPVRVTHVLRAKVCSASSRNRGVFLFNTWQQFAEGRKRTRNALLSEKLTLAEVPLEDHLEEVCQRALNEEMHRVVEAAFVISPGRPPPIYDAAVLCPIKVEKVHFVDHTTEVENSKSFPGLLTLYHLYTVDIVCSGLPGVDFNTLEYHPPSVDGERKLKYVHAWTWLDWKMIKRYLLEGSELKERKTKGSFEDPRALREWLSDLVPYLDDWGVNGYRSVQDLWEDLEKQQTQLELWGRHDGVPLLVRVLHILQLKANSTDPRLAGRFLLHAWQQDRQGVVRPINRLVSKKLSVSKFPLGEMEFAKEAQEAVTAQFAHIMDVHFQLHPKLKIREEDLSPSGATALSVRFVDHHYDVEESRSYKGMLTMYHVYMVEAEVEGLPAANFTGLDMSKSSAPWANGFRWVSWPEVIDILHGRIIALERRNQSRGRRSLELGKSLESARRTLHRLAITVGRMVATIGDAEEGVIASEAERLLRSLQAEMGDLRSLVTKPSEVDQQDEFNSALPPSMVCKMASDALITDCFREEAQALARRIISHHRTNSNGHMGRNNSTPLSLSHQLSQPSNIGGANHTVTSKQESTVPSGSGQGGQLLRVVPEEPPADSGGTSKNLSRLPTLLSSPSVMLASALSVAQVALACALVALSAPVVSSSGSSSDNSRPEVQFGCSVALLLLAFLVAGLIIFEWKRGSARLKVMPRADT